MKVLIVIISYNGEDLIQNCLASLDRSSLNKDILIIDNNSNDLTVKIIRDRFPFVKIIEKKRNCGFGKANNIGFRYAIENSYDFIFLLNQDVYVQVNTIEKLISVSRDNPEYGILSPIHLNGLGDKIDSNFLNYISGINCPSFLSDYIIGKQLNEIYHLNFVNAAAWLLPIETLKNVGGFDPIFFHYGEDNNYCQRVLYHGFKIGIVSDCFIRHDRSQELRLIDRYENLAHFETSVNVECGNINNPLINTKIWEVNEVKRRIFISFFSFNYRGFVKWIRYYLHLRMIFPKIVRSRDINIIKGSNYLNG